MKIVADTKKINYNGLDLLKFILANFIIVLHCGPLKDLSSVGHFYLRDGLTRMAVPMFFAFRVILCLEKWILNT